jgi:membrane protein YqaA with SNARE-associated domain
MKIFSSLYDRVLRWSSHPQADRYLAGMSFAESSFFPVPVDVLLAPMTLAKPEKWLRFGLIATAASVLGGLLGYLIGYLALEAVSPLLHKLGYWHHFQTASDWFDRYGFWAMFAAGFTPMPFKVFTIAAGAAHMGMVPFVIGSIIGRGARFVLVSGLVRWGGPKIEPHLRRYMDLIGWVTLALMIVGFTAWRLLR